VSDAGERPAFYALSPGRWRDYWTLLHPPYTLLHLSFVAIGASLAAVVDLRWLGETLLAFFLAIGLSAHALDELKGRPLRTRISDRTLWVISVVGLSGAIALGVDASMRISPWIAAFVVVGSFLVVAYNLELFHGAFHSDAWFALAWGGFPALTGYFAQTARVSIAAVIVGLACALVSMMQRTLSTPVRRLRRHVELVEGRLRLRDGSTERIDSDTLRAAPEDALRWLSLAFPLLAVGLVVNRWP
jgi:hypothetical protein